MVKVSTLVIVLKLLFNHTIAILEQNEGNVCGRLLVMILEAENLQTSHLNGKTSILFEGLHAMGSMRT